ncbi:MAG: glycosyltransferase family 39 protein [Phototrophicales bacterium]|nr:glycosyltransferase family 39 protein [Phototrophicales bacterium]
MQKLPPLSQPKIRFSIHQWLVVALMLTSFITTWLVNDRVFEHLPHLEDEIAYLFQARVFAQGELLLDTPTPALAYWQPFVLTDNQTGKKFGKYPMGYPALMSIGIHLGGIWLINAFSSMLSVGLVYKIGRVLFNSEIGLFASALMTFSPMALLLSGTMMSHTPAITLFVLFLYSFIWIEKGRYPIRWGVMAGLALGLFIINRPLTSVAVSLPFILWAGIKTARAVVLDGWRVLLSLDNWLDTEKKSWHMPQWRQLWRMSLTAKWIVPYACIGVLALAFSRATPIFNFTATGNASENLYLRVWSYDRLGFGDGYGRNGHTITKGVRHARYDLSLTAGDLFGWAIQRPRAANNRFTNVGWEIADVGHPTIQKHLLESSAYYPVFGLSLFILPIGLFIGFRLWWMRLWLLGGFFWLLTPFVQNASWLEKDEATLWAWLLIGLGWILIPLGIFILMYSSKMRPKRVIRFDWALWTWLLLAVCVSLIGWHLAYWVGSQRYTTRYYAEALPAFALIGALGFYGILHGTRQLVGWIFDKKADGARFIVTCVGYATIFTLLLGSMYLYSIPRINALYRFNNVSPYMTEQIRARATDDRPILVLVNGKSGEISWRAFGSVMALTDPYLEGDIIAAWNYAPDNATIRESILARFPNRQVIELNILNIDAWFVDCDITQNPACNLNPPPK